MLLATYLSIFFSFLLKNKSAVNFSADKSAASNRVSVANKHKYFHGIGPKTSFMATQHETTSVTFFFFSSQFPSWVVFSEPWFLMMSDSQITQAFSFSRALEVFNLARQLDRCRFGVSNLAHSLAPAFNRERFQSVLPFHWSQSPSFTYKEAGVARASEKEPR